MQMEPLHARFRVETNLEILPADAFHLNNVSRQKMELLQERQVAPIQLKDTIII